MSHPRSQVRMSVPKAAGEPEVLDSALHHALCSSQLLALLRLRELHVPKHRSRRHIGVVQ